MNPIPITQELITIAESWSTFEGNEFTKDLKNPNRVLQGRLGEICFQKYFKKQGYNLKRISDIDHHADFIMKDKSENKRIEIKTRGGSYKPKENYLVDLLAYQKHYKFDKVFFCYLDNKNQLMYLIGGLNKEDFYNKAIFCPAGSNAHIGLNAFREDNYALEMKDLNLIINL